MEGSAEIPSGETTEGGQPFDPEGGAVGSTVVESVGLTGQGADTESRSFDESGRPDFEVVHSVKGSGVRCSLSIATWNCACLLNRLPQAAEARERLKTKMDMVTSMAKRYDVLFLQETHGTEDDIAVLQRLLPNFLIAGSFCRNPRSGGVMVVVNPNLLPN